jgi:hypothetical protein
MKMMRASKTRSIPGVAFLAAVCAVIVAATVFATVSAIVLAIPARAADPVFPVGSRLGLVPPPGMIPSPAFSGFVDPNKDAAILLVTFPPIAFDQLDKSMVPEELKKQGIDVTQREPVELGFGKGFVVHAKQTTNKGRYRKWLLVAAASDITALVTIQVPDDDTAYSDKVLNDSLATLALRASVPDAERLSLLPFKVGDMAGFHIDDVLPGRALMLIDASTAPATTQHAHFLIAAMEGGPTETQDRDEFAQVTFSQINGLKDVQIQDAEALRIGGQTGYETLAKAKDGTSGNDVRVVQWLRFGSGSYIQMIGIAPADQWPDVFARLRTVRDSVDPK